ncbi:putative CAP_GLY [Lyophyllum shimeji]|uniref:CAP_GLY n=1 Tax=Lyophyllum shimeji TaxID=47721 RepID=A0A9P3Q1K8_LYOSH|nr:putative CAP_GLY [Lyophyllum shimeji]
MPNTTVVVSSPALQEATKRSTIVWRQDLEALFHHAKDRFPDVVWELGGGQDDGDEREVWGHKAIVYARAPPSFQTRYFSFRPTPYASSPPPTTSALSLDISRSSRTPSPFRSSSPSPSAAPTTANGILRLSTTINPALFSNELEYLYTGQGFGEAFEFLFDSAESTHGEADAGELRIDKLRKDLVFMWRSRLYSDVRIALTGNFSSSNHENTTAIFSSHRFILVSRSPYFHTALIAWPKQQEQQVLTLPSPPFTPASLHFTLGFIYTGTLIFSHRSYDLDTAFHIMRSATYLSLPTLYDEIQARIVQEMTHGLFHAFLPFPEYERLTNGAWGTGGCRCRQCARRAPRVLEFSLADDVKNGLLERGARRALVGLFGEGWCTSEFAALPMKLRESLLKGVGKRTTPKNAFALLFAAEHALGRLAAVIDAWAGDVKEMVLAARKVVDEVVCGQSDACFGGTEWNEIMERDGVAFEDAERVQWIMASTLVSSILLRPHPTETDAPMLSSTSHVRVQVEQARVDLLKWIGKRWLGIRQEGGFDELEGWALKEICDNIEVPLEDVLTPSVPASHSHLKPHNPPRQSTLLRAKENESNNDTISMHSSMRVSVRSRNLPVNSGTRPQTSSTATSYKSAVRASASTSSLSRNSPLAQEQRDKDEDLDNSRPDSKLTPGLGSVGLPDYSRSASPTQPSIVEPEDRDQGRTAEYEETDSVLDGAGPSSTLPRSLSLDHNQHPSADATPTKKIIVRKVMPSTRPATATTPKTRSPVVPGSSRPVSSASSIRSSAASVRSVASTIRKSTVTDTSKAALRPPKTTHTPVSPTVSTRSLSRDSVASTSQSTLSTSNASESSTAFRTASTTIRSRRTSAASVVSTVSTNSPRGGRETPTRGGKSVPAAVAARTRKTSAGSTKTSVAGATPTKRPPLPAVDTNKLTPAGSTSRRPVSSASSIRSTTSTVSTAASVAARKALTGAGRKAGNGSPVEKTKEADVVEHEKEQEKKVSVPAPPPEPSETAHEEASSVPALPNTSSSTTIKGKSREEAALDHKKSSSTTSTGSASTLKRRGSSDTITTKMSSRTASSGKAPASKPAPSPAPATKALKENQPLPTLPIVARGATLEIGIPCIISSKRKRFKAYARYIGEVEGEEGPWVGVEVPVSDAWGGAGGDRDDGERQWNDGTWGGIRYFEIGSSAGSEWDYGAGSGGLGGDDRAARRRRVDWVGGGSGSSGAGRSVLKREGDQLSVERVKRFRSVSPAISDASGIESRGLFVRPQQVLYVVDAVGSDL